MSVDPVAASRLAQRSSGDGALSRSGHVSLGVSAGRDDEDGTGASLAGRGVLGGVVRAAATGSSRRTGVLDRVGVGFGAGVA